MSRDSVIASDVGGTQLRVAIVDADGSVRERQAISIPRSDPDSLVRVLRSALDGVGGAVAAAVVGMPGPVDYFGGKVLKLPNLPEWEGRVSAESLSRELGLPVLMANDADLAALGEHRYGAGVGSDDMVYVTSSTGVGGGVIIGGRLLHGRLSLAEVGHTIIDRRTLETVEDLGSGTALARLAGRDAASVSADAEGGDAQALRQFGSVAKDFAIGVYNMVHCFAPEIVVIGGGMSQAGDLLIGPVREMLARCDEACPASKARVVRAAGGDDVGLKGAAAFWSDHRQANFLTEQEGKTALMLLLEQKFGQDIKELIRGGTVRELGLRLGVHYSLIHRWRIRFARQANPLS